MEHRSVRSAGASPPPGVKRSRSARLCSFENKRRRHADAKGPRVGPSSQLRMLAMSQQADVSYFKGVAHQVPTGSDTLTYMRTMDATDSRRKGKLINPSTLSHPNLKEIVLSVAIAIQTLLQRAAPSTPVTFHDPLLVFDERVYITTLQPWSEDGALSVERIGDFVGKSILRADFSCEVLITAVCLFARFTRLMGAPQSQIPVITPSKWRLLFLTCLLIAQKTWDDSSLDNLSFEIIWRYAAPSKEDEPSLKHFNEMESLFLNLMRFDVYVSPRVYAEVYFELSSIYLKQFGTAVPIKPLDAEQSSFLDSTLPKNASADGANHDLAPMRTF